MTPEEESKIDSMTEEELVMNLSRFGFKEDELDTLYPTVEDKRKVLKESRGLNAFGGNAGDASWEEDTVTLSGEAAKEVKMADDITARASKARAKVQQARKDQEELYKTGMDSTLTPKDMNATREQLRKLLEGADDEA